MLRQTRDVAARRQGDRPDAPHPTDIALRPQLRASVTAYVVGLRREQLPPQTVVVLIKALLREGLPPRVDPAAERELTAAVVRWCIEAYYDGAAQSPHGGDGA